MVPSSLSLLLTRYGSSACMQPGENITKGIFFSKKSDIGLSDMSCTLYHVLTALTPLCAAQESFFKEKCKQQAPTTLHPYGLPVDLCLPGERSRSAVFV